ncbi:hypothetical protein DMUE_1127 [Dictyocoela muelleri]|nr:hypothetical protein DMUE_1127 [Dictyocoela muelleri]
MIFSIKLKIKNLEQCIQAILQFKYNNNTAEMYSEKNKRIYQEYSININDYVEEQEKALNELFIAKNYNKHVQEFKSEEAFFDGLTTNTIIFLSQHDIKRRKSQLKKLKVLSKHWNQFS